ncbi:Mitochondrial GTPase 1 [Phlyctema vagabunda]|uniref:Mitochondrial GTPase 1 n=1 Tax=Phlyctema vagabunda TaxID=108571 RepID=A0ABR4PG98_9HELO
MATSFVPRAVFPTQLSLPRSYFLGHHASGLSKMKTMLSHIDLIIECRDYRVPLTSRNPLFESSLAGRERVVVYTKRDLGSKDRPKDREARSSLSSIPFTCITPPPLKEPLRTANTRKFILLISHVFPQRESIIRAWHAPAATLFSNHKSKRDMTSILQLAKEHAQRNASLTGLRILVVGMPNVGKSSMLNALRATGVHRGKAAITGAQPGVTRKIASGVKIVDADPVLHQEAVYLVDTPGVFIPFVPNAEAMLKLALCGSVKDTIIGPTTLADYLLFHVNKHSPQLYQEYSRATNDIIELLEAVCNKTGRLGKGGVPDIEAAALWMIQKWRQGNLGTFILDDVTPDGLEKKMNEEVGMSLHQAKKAKKEAQRLRTSLRVAGEA